ncbi:hypothetical protein INR49_000603, partial [Caranx melampygus]
TMGHVWSAWGPNPEEGQMVSGIEDRTPINMRKERDRGGGTVKGVLLTTLRAPVRDLRPSHLGLQLGARMRRHADSISEWNNLFTNLPDTGRLGVD